MAAFCSAPYACLSATFSASANTSSTTLSCTEKNACADMIVTVDHDGYFNDSNTSFNIYCTDPSACIDMDITFRDVSNKNHYGIHCVAPDSCTNLKITTSAEKTQLIMYEHSDNIVFDNGIGYLSADNNVECNTNRYIKFQGDMNETVDSVSTAVMNEYMNGLPCSDIQILCGNKACGMTYHVNPTKIQSLNTELNYAGCYWINVDIIQDFWCEGECEYSPTPPPTFTPTQQPTQPTSNPSMSPSSAPTISPSSAPTHLPTIPPSQSPSVPPSAAPSGVPTSIPSAAPSLSPSNTPSVSPSISPSNFPSISPSDAPSYSPSITPSTAPTFSPSTAPSFSPSTAPSNAPSIAPSDAPSYSPSNSPSSPPSAAPTRVPTRDVDDIYKYRILVQYALSNLTTSNVEFIVNNTLKAANAMQQIIERRYFSDETLEYSQFYVYIESINDKNFREESEDETLTVYDLDILYLKAPVILDTQIDCAERVSDSILIKTATDSFTETVQSEMRTYFDNNHLIFSVESDTDELRAQSKFGPAPDYTAVYLSIAVLVLGFLGTAAAFLMNQMSGTKVDNADFAVPLLISIAMYDFYSDINFAIQVWYRASGTMDDLKTWLAIGATFFTITPLVTNLAYAMRISRQKTIEMNPAARAWFTQNLNMFIVISFMCSGTYPALLLVSSRIYGVDFFNTGLLHSELHELSKIKIKSTVLMENAPQLLIQIVYSFTIGEIESGTLLAFVASSLSVAASLIIYQAQKDLLSQGHMNKYFIKFYDTAGQKNIDQKQQLRIRQKKGLKEKMAFALSSAFQSTPKSIEVGFVTLMGNGCVINIQHFVFEDDMENLREKLRKKLKNAGARFHGIDVQVTSDMFVENLYDIHRKPVADALSYHFFDHVDGSFSVSYHKTYKKALALDADDDSQVVAVASPGNKHVMSDSSSDNACDGGELTEMVELTRRKDRKNMKSNMLLTQEESENVQNQTIMVAIQEMQQRMEQQMQQQTVAMQQQIQQVVQQQLQQVMQQIKQSQDAVAAPSTVEVDEKEAAKAAGKTGAKGKKKGGKKRLPDPKTGKKRKASNAGKQRKRTEAKDTGKKRKGTRVKKKKGNSD
eukprot:426756_1